jgi:hypothetical protein
MQKMVEINGVRFDASQILSYTGQEICVTDFESPSSAPIPGMKVQTQRGIEIFIPAKKEEEGYTLEEIVITLDKYFQADQIS